MRLAPASAIAKRYGVKCIVYGAPGAGKTPIAATTTPNPIMLAAEPGLLSIRNCNVPVAQGFNLKDIGEFFAWLDGSSEAKKYDTVIIDSISNIAEQVLTYEEQNQKNLMQAYGALSKSVMVWANQLFHTQDKHVVMIAKQMADDSERQTSNGTLTLVHSVKQKRPYFPGRDLNVKIPHLFDAVLHLGEAMFEGCSFPVRALRTKENPSIFARDRSGNLDELEEADFTKLFAKSLSK